MLRYFRVKQQPDKYAPDRVQISVEDLERDPALPITLHQINQLPQNAKMRVYRGLLPPSLLARYGIDPITWRAGDQPSVRLQAEPETGAVKLGVRTARGAADEFIQIELSDTAMNGIELNFLILNDPEAETFRTDREAEGQPTYFGTVRRNLEEEQRAKEAGLAPGQIRQGLGGSRQALEQLEAFLALLGHRGYSLEPLSYASAWLFERRGFAYVRGHKLMATIHQEFQPGGRLYQALDQSTPFRNPDQWNTVRGRAWAIHDGILEQIEATWNGLRMIKQIGRQAGVETFPQPVY
jgi:hypothetical protein